MDETLLRGTFGLTADKDTKATKRNSPKAGTAPRAKRSGEPHVADALRNAYEQAVSEDVPQEFIDLLGKLA